MKRAGNQASKLQNKKIKKVAFDNNVEVKEITPIKVKNKKKVKQQTKKQIFRGFQDQDDDKVIAEYEKTVSMNELANDGLDIFFNIESYKGGESDESFELEEDLPPIVSDEESEEDLSGSSDESINDGKTEIQHNITDKKSEVSSEVASQLYNELSSKESKEVLEEEVKPVGKYVPPALRKKMGIQTGLIQTKDRSKEVQSSHNQEKIAAPKKFTEHLMHNKEDLKLKHTINGHLNKLSFENLHKIVKSVKKLAEEKSRGKVNDIIVSLLMTRLDCKDPVPERYNSDCAIFISILTTHHGMTLFANFIEKLAHKFMDIGKLLFGESPNLAVLSGKSLNNVVNMFCSLYELKSICKVLMFDVLNYFVESKLTEKKLEIILLILQKVLFVTT